jgi:hypothetical protein
MGFLWGTGSTFFEICESSLFGLFVQLGFFLKMDEIFEILNGISKMELFLDGLIILNTVAMIARWIERESLHGSWDCYMFAAGL